MDAKGRLVTESTEAFRPRPWTAKAIQQGKWAYLCYRWGAIPRRLPTPRIARGVGRWVPSRWEAISCCFSKRGRFEGGFEAVWAFPRRLTTETEVAALKHQPQEDW